jgi:hypothetical protein
VEVIVREPAEKSFIPGLEVVESKEWLELSRYRNPEWRAEEYGGVANPRHLDHKSIYRAVPFLIPAFVKGFSPKGEGKQKKRFNELPF